MPELETRSRLLRDERREVLVGFCRLGLLALLVAIPVTTSSISSRSWSSFPSKPRVRTLSLLEVSALLLLLLETGLVWTAFYCADLLGVLVSRRLIASTLVLVLGPSTPLIMSKEDSSSYLFKGELGDIILLTEDLGDGVHGRRHFSHENHGLDVVGNVDLCFC
jgi:hypothetical protein